MFKGKVPFKEIGPSLYCVQNNYVKQNECTPSYIILCLFLFFCLLHFEYSLPTLVDALLHSFTINAWTSLKYLGVEYSVRNGGKLQYIKDSLKAIHFDNNASLFKAKLGQNYYIALTN